MSCLSFIPCNKICILYGFPCEMDFSQHESPNPTRASGLGWDLETSGEKSISHGKPCKMLFLAYFTLQGTLIKLNTLCKVADYENHVRWIYLTTVLCIWGKVRSMREYFSTISWLLPPVIYDNHHMWCIKTYKGRLEWLSFLHMWMVPFTGDVSWRAGRDGRGLSLYGAFRVSYAWDITELHSPHTE